MADAFVIRGVDNSSIAFCNLECYGTYLYYADNNDVVSGKKLKPSKITCFYCIGCGKRIYPCSTCLIHGDSGCPERIWFTSLPMFAEFMEFWNANTDSKPLTEKHWDFIDQLAIQFPILSGDDLADIAISHLEK